jgi:hypothetical protein
MNVAVKAIEYDDAEVAVLEQRRPLLKLAGGDFRRQPEAAREALRASEAAARINMRVVVTTSLHLTIEFSRTMTTVKKRIRVALQFQQTLEGDSK